MPEMDSRADPKIDAFLVLRSEGRLLINRERIALLEAVARYGSLTKAAKTLGFSYASAHLSVNAINTLLPRPAFSGKTGGATGGGTSVTNEGLRLIALFRKLEDQLGRISASIAQDGLKDATDGLSLGRDRRLSTCNAFGCKIVEIKPALVNNEIKLEVTPDINISALVTGRTIAELGLIQGGTISVIISNITTMLTSTTMAGRMTGRNKIEGRVVARADSGESSEIKLNIGHGKIFEVAIARTIADEVGAQVGAMVFAVFDSAHVILAAD
jgi:molybdate transport system regulatory protein